MSVMILLQVLALLMLYNYRSILVTIYLLLVSYNCVTCCKDQCYMPEGIEIWTSSGKIEDDLVNNGICYSLCGLNIQVGSPLVS